MKLASFAFAFVFLAAARAAAQSPTAGDGGQRLTLEAAVAEALDKNPALAARRAGLRVADANLASARLRPNPILSLGGDHLDLLGTGFDETNGAGPPEYSVRVDYLIERAGKRQRRIVVAGEERHVAEADLLDAVRTLTLDVRTAFADLQLAQQNLTLARENGSAFDEIVRLNEARLRSGDLAEVELLRSRVAAVQSQQAIRQAELTLRVERRRLEQLMGRTPGLGTFDIEELPLPPRPDGTTANLIARALRHRPDIASWRRAQARAAAEIRLQLAHTRPDITLGAEYRRQQGLAGKGSSIGLFASTPLPFFDRNQGGIARAREEARIVDVRVREAELVVAGDVNLAVARCAAAAAALDSFARDMLPQATDVRTITDYAYRRGEATLIQFLDAQRAFNETAQAWNEARAEYARSVFAVRAAVGEEQQP